MNTMRLLREMTMESVAAVDPPLVAVTLLGASPLPTCLVQKEGEVIGIFLSAKDADYYARLIDALRKIPYPSAPDLSMLAWLRNACAAVGETGHQVSEQSLQVTSRNPKQSERRP